MSSHHQYINNESNSEPSINQYENIFKYYINNPPSLEEALTQMFNSSKLSPIKSKSLCDQIMSKVNNHLNTKFSEIKSKYKNITYEDAQIISSYTCELNDFNYNPYKILNTNLVSDDRMNGIRNISKYLFLLLKALRKLDRYYPDAKRKYLYRCISTQVRLDYDSFDKKKIPYLCGEKKLFWGFSSASTNPQTSFQFLGNNNQNSKYGTIFSLTGDIWGYDITLFNVFYEEEILIEPEREIMIEESIPPINDVIYVRCNIKKTSLVLENIFKQINISKNINNKMNLISNNNMNKKNQQQQQEINIKIQENKQSNININNNITKKEEQDDIEMKDDTNPINLVNQMSQMPKNQININLLKITQTKSSPTPTSPSLARLGIIIPYKEFIKSTDPRLPPFLPDLSFDNTSNNIKKYMPIGTITVQRNNKSGNLKEFMNIAKQEFNYLRQIIDTENSHKLRLDQNNSNCRYGDIITYKDNRVLLNSSFRFINASWIHMPLPNYFISTQGPLPHTIEDFWTMIDQNNISLIIMLCNLRENNVDKCADYWNNVNNLKYLEIRLLSEKEQPKGIFIRNIQLKNKLTNRENTVTQIHLTYWEDHTAIEPSYFDKIIEIIKFIDDIKNKDLSPCVVHCSAGVGRTGTLICLYNLYHEIMRQILVYKNEWISFCIMNLVRKMKEMRMYSVENENQYLLLYDFADYLLSNNNVNI